MKTLHATVSCLLLSLAATACAAPEPTPAEDWPPATLDEIALPGDQLFPEGIAIGEDGTFYVGSLTDGSLLRLRPGQAEPEIFVPGGELEARTLGSAVGMIVDAAQDVLWVCDGGGLMGERTSAVVGISLPDGAEAVRHPLPGGTGLCNDLAQYAEGNLYATDSLGPRLVRIAADARLDDDAAEEWIVNEAWAVEPGQFGLNGIDVRGDTLFVAHTQQNAVYRVPRSATAASDVVRIELDPTPNGLDGLKIAGDGSLVFVEGYADQLTRIVLDGDRGRLEVLEDDLDGPTTFAFFADSAWIVEGQLPHLFDPMAGPPNLPFRVVRRELDPALLP